MAATLSAGHGLLLALIFCVAFLYSTVGHGGASGYLAVMSLFAFNPRGMSLTALILNMIVSAVAFLSYKNAGHFKKSLLYPFLILSIPAAWIGGSLRVPEKSYAALLAFTLLFAAARLSFNLRPELEREEESALSLPICLLVGGVIGLLSGIVGIGGGIFLSSFLLLAGWSTTKESSAVAAPFIFINSIAALIPRLTGSSAAVLGSTWGYALAALAGGLLGSHLGAHRFSVSVLRKILGLVLVLAASKLIFRR